jgi:hypothetical protein
MAFDAHRNFAISLVTVVPSPPNSGTSLTVTAGEGALFPAAPFNATVCPSGVLPTSANAEIVRVTARTGDVLTISRAQEGSTARTILTGDLIVASITAKALQDIETTPYARTDAANTFVAGQTLSEATPNVVFRETAAPVDAKVWQLLGSGQTWVIRTLNDAGSSPSSSFTFTRPGDFVVWRDLYEKQRTTPIGHWISVPYNAGNYSANVGTWTVEAGDQTWLEYTVIGKTMMIGFQISSTSVSGSPVNLQMVLPGGFTETGYIRIPYAYQDNGVAGTGVAIALNGKVLFAKDVTGSATWTTSTNNTGVFGTVIVHIL